MKKFILSLTIVAMAGVANAEFIVDNYITEQNGATGGAVGTFGVQSFTPNVAGLGVNDTITANSPLPAMVWLESATFLRAVSGTATAGQLFINVYEGDGDDGTFLGSSTNSIDVNGASGLDVLTWSFDPFLTLNSGLEHGLVFSTDATAGNSVGARLQVARDSGGLFNNTYTGGTADNNADNSSPSVFDSRFQVNLAPITPEPSSIALLGLGLVGLSLFGWRRRRR